MSPLTIDRSSTLDCSSALTVYSSSLSDCISSLEVVSSSLVDCSSSLVDCSSSLADLSSSREACISSRTLWISSRACISCCSSSCTRGLDERLRRRCGGSAAVAKVTSIVPAMGSPSGIASAVRSTASGGVSPSLSSRPRTAVRPPPRAAREIRSASSKRSPSRAMAWMFQLALPAAGSRKVPVRPWMYRMSPCGLSSAAAGVCLRSRCCSTWCCRLPLMDGVRVSLAGGGAVLLARVGK